jgi:DNA-binding LacI/PurR family transcriptional regulator
MDESSKRTQVMIRQKHIIELLKRRIERGAYRSSGLPAERELADEIGVARMTARKALSLLEEQNIAQRLDTGRLVLHKSVKQKKQVAILFPSLASSGIQSWVADARSGAKDLDIYIKPVYYDSYDDITLLETIQKSDGVFFIPRAETMPGWIQRALMWHPKVIVLEIDSSAMELPCINFFSPLAIHQLLNHLGHLGFERIDCINNQGLSEGVELRINEWRNWRELFEIKGDLLDLFPVAGYDAEKQKLLIHKYLSNEKTRAPAIVCTSLETAVLVIRVANDLKLQLGKDLALCLMDGESKAKNSTPSITSLERPDSSMYLKKCMKWMIDPKAKWSGPYLMDIIGVELFVGETTVPALYSGASS